MTENQDSPIRTVGSPNSTAAPSAYNPPTRPPAHNANGDKGILLALGALVGIPVGIAGLIWLLARGKNAPTRFSATALTKDTYSDYLSKAAFRVTSKVKYKFPAEQVFKVLSSNGAYGWIPFIKGVQYPTDYRGEGAERAFRSIAVAAIEQVVDWDEGKKFAFTVTSSSMPLVLGSFAEEYVFEPTKKGDTQLTWRLGFTPRFFGWVPLRLAAPVIRPILKFGVRRAKKVLKAKPELAAA